MSARSTRSVDFPVVTRASITTDSLTTMVVVVMILNVTVKRATHRSDTFANTQVFDKTLTTNRFVVSGARISDLGHTRNFLLAFNLVLADHGRGIVFRRLT